MNDCHGDLKGSEMIFIKRFHSGSKLIRYNTIRTNACL